MLILIYRIDFKSLKRKKNLTKQIFINMDLLQSTFNRQTIIREHHFFFVTTTAAKTEIEIFALA
jgi:hypothetical protein